MYPNPNQYPLQQQPYKPVQEYPAQGQESSVGKVPNPEIQQQGYMGQGAPNTSYPVDNKQMYNYANPAAPQGQYYSYRKS